MTIREWIAALEIAADAIHRQDGGLMSDQTGWADQELLDAWKLIRQEISRLYADLDEMPESDAPLPT